MDNILKQRKIWLSGSRGFIGTHLVSELQKFCNIHRITNTKYEATSNSDNQPTYVDFQSETSINEAIKNLELPDIFIHLGWGDMTNPHSEMHIRANVDQSNNLIKVLYENGLDN